MGTTTVKQSKIVAVVTYCVALICLILGLFLPYNFENAVDTMLFSQLPAAVDALFKTELAAGEGFFHSAFTYTFPVKFFGLGENAIDFGAVLVLLYTLFTLGGIIALIPVFASKKESRTALKAASVIEILALLPLFVLVFVELEKLALGGFDSFVWIWGLWAAFGGTLLMLIVQCFAYKKGSGFIKFFLFLLSALAILLAVFPVTSIIPPLADLLDGKLGDIGLGLFGNEAGFTYLMVFFQTNFTEAFANMDALTIVMFIASIAAMVLVVLNAMLDMMGLGKLTSKALLICNIVRYALEVIAVAVMIVMSFVIENLTADAGLMLYVLAGIAFVQLVINIIRTCVYKPVKFAATETVVLSTKKEKKEKKEKNKPEKAKKEKPVKEEEPKAEVASETAAVAAAEKPAETDPLVYNVGPIYNGPTDEFINKLTNEEKIEFAKVFLERRTGNLPTIPNYEVGGNNSKFFASIFIYYGRIRGLVSDGLMNKFYEQGNIMN